MEIIVTKHKVAHIIQDGRLNGLFECWCTMCGKWVLPVKIADAADALPEGVRMCKLCQKFLRNNDAQSN